MVVLDTCALIFLTVDRGKLSPNAVSHITRADRIIISSISIWEIGLKHKRGKLGLPMSFREWVDDVNCIFNFEFHAVDVSTWIRNIELDWDHKDPADRTIVATAQLLGCELITSDQRILDFYPKAVW